MKRRWSYARESSAFSSIVCVLLYMKQDESRTDKAKI